MKKKKLKTHDKIEMLLERVERLERAVGYGNVVRGFSHERF